MNLELKGQRALVTGADSGIGLATARQLADEGAVVVMTDLDEDALREAARTVSGEPTIVAADLTDPASVARLHDATTAALGGPLDILVQCAGTTGAQGRFQDIDDDGWRFTVGTDLLGPVRLLRTFLPGMKQRGTGSVVVVTSEDAVQTYVEETPYAAAKAGLLNLVKALSKTYGPDGVRVNAVSPAFIATPMTDTMIVNKAEERGVTFDDAVTDTLDNEKPGLTAHRRGDAAEVSAVIVFLCSARASFVNGSNYRVDSGAVHSIT